MSLLFYVMESQIQIHLNVTDELAGNCWPKSNLDMEQSGNTHRAKLKGQWRWPWSGLSQPLALSQQVWETVFAMFVCYPCAILVLPSFSSPSLSSQSHLGPGSHPQIPGQLRSWSEPLSGATGSHRGDWLMTGHGSQYGQPPPQQHFEQSSSVLCPDTTRVGVQNLPLLSLLSTLEPAQNANPPTCHWGQHLDLAG